MQAPKIRARAAQAASAGNLFFIVLSSRSPVASAAWPSPMSGREIGADANAIGFHLGGILYLRLSFPSARRGLFWAALLSQALSGAAQRGPPAGFPARAGRRKSLEKRLAGIVSENRGEAGGARKIGKPQPDSAGFAAPQARARD